MCIKQTKIERVAFALPSLASLGLMALLQFNQVQAQVPPGCTPGGLGSSILVTPTLAHVGETITIQQVGVNLGAANCQLENGEQSITYPNGTSQTTMTGFALAPGQQQFCTGAAGAPCVPFTTTYTIQAADVGDALVFTTPIGEQCTAAGIPNTVVFMTSASADLVNSPNLTAFGCGNARVTVISPCITITKECVNPCTPIGQPIQIRGTVSNSGDTTLFNITATDNPVIPLVFATTTTLGNSYPANGDPATAQLVAGDSVTYTGSYTPTGNACGPFTDTISVTATDVTGFQVSNVDACINPATGQSTGPRAAVTATCHVQTAPALSLTKVCSPTQVNAGQSYTETITVNNTGNVTLNNVVISDNNSKLGVSTFNCPTPLAPGASCQWVRTITTTTADCGTITDTASATAQNSCPADATCPAAASVTSNQGTCTVTVVCPPCIEVTKEIACAIGDLNTCPAASNYGETATGVLGDDPNAFPHFCYRIRVTNCGQVALTGVTLTDPTLQITENIGNLAVGASTPFFYYMRGWGVDTLNTATATGVSAVTQEQVTDTDTAQALVLNASLTCEKLVSLPGGTPTATLEISGSTAVVYYVRVTNTGDVPLDVTINDPNCPEPVALAEPLAPGATTDILEVCTVDVTCPDGLVNTITVTATVSQPDEGPEFCDLDGTGQPITASSTCTATITCRAQAGCTPGFWKNCTVHWGPTGYQLTDLVQDVFPNVATCCPSLGGNKTLLQALSFKGGAGDCGGAGNLLRAGVAALLNASSTEVDYPRTEAEVLADVNAALGGCDRNTMLQLAGDLDSDNNLGCRGADGEGLPCKVIR